jgi:UDP-N-acetylglucosamine--N-acetylmuramyl-(pentapeptide) pyrophosphoryl-undecaprenol N-acetylglucosamine transferase
MKILLTGGGSGGHITPLLAVARELKQLDPNCIVIGVCERNARFLHLFQEEPAIDEVRQVRAGKYRRYAGLSRLQRMLDVPTVARNIRDIGRVVKGYTEARKLLKQLKPDGILIKGGFVGVPIGLAAAHLGIPFITHDSDATPGLANRVIAKWARLHATGMPVEFYHYPKNMMVYTGVPVAADFMAVDTALQKTYRSELGLKDCKQVITIIGGSQGGLQLNEDVIAIAGQLMQHYHGLGIIHIVGAAYEQAMKRHYAEELLADERQRVVVKGFVSDVFRYTGAADIVVSRASATVVAELAVQGIATILVPGQLADDHQVVNAHLLDTAGAARAVAYADREGLYAALHNLLDDNQKRAALASSLAQMAKPAAARELAELLLKTFGAGQRDHGA